MLPISVLLQKFLPQQFLSRLINKLALCSFPPIKNFLIGKYIEHFNISLRGNLITDPKTYENFNAFFTRELESSSRKISRGGIASPVDGTISQIGKIKRGSLIQAKNHEYDLDQLVVNETSIANNFRSGFFATIYLSPRDYHRIHMPLSGRLQTMVYVPGKLFSVSPLATEHVPNLFANNERVISLFETEEAGPMAIIQIGAIFVSSMETVWHGEINSKHHKLRTWNYHNHQHKEYKTCLEKGEEMGRFNMGSTVILLFADNRIAWKSDLTSGSRILMGIRIGRPTSSAKLAQKAQPARPTQKTKPSTKK